MRILKDYHINTARTNIRSLTQSLAIFVLSLFMAQYALAEEVVLSTGEKFTSSKVWEEGGKIRFNMHGLVVSVNKSEVVAIIGDDGVRHQFASPTPEPQTAPSLSPPVQKAGVPEPTVKPPAEPTNPAPIPKQKSPPVHQVSPENQRKSLGLRNVKWLVSPADIHGLEMMKQDPAYGGIDQYWRPDERMQFGHAMLDGKVYGFWRNQLYSIMMWAEGRIGYERLREAVLTRYGNGRKNKEGLERYVWDDASTDQMLQFDTELNTGFFWMRSRKLDNQIKKRYPNG